MDELKITPAKGWCAVRFNREDRTRWIDTSTFSATIDECRNKLYTKDLINEAAGEFAKKNPAVMILEVTVRAV